MLPVIVLPKSKDLVSGRLVKFKVTELAKALPERSEIILGSTLS